MKSQINIMVYVSNDFFKKSIFLVFLYIFFFEK